MSLSFTAFVYHGILNLPLTSEVYDKFDRVVDSQDDYIDKHIRVLPGADIENTPWKSRFVSMFQGMSNANRLAIIAEWPSKTMFEDWRADPSGQPYRQDLNLICDPTFKARLARCDGTEGSIFRNEIQRSLSRDVKYLNLSHWYITPETKEMFQATFEDILPDITSEKSFGAVYGSWVIMTSMPPEDGLIGFIIVLSPATTIDVDSNVLTFLESLPIRLADELKSRNIDFEFEAQNYDNLCL